MSFKPEFPVDRPVALTGVGVLSVQGADAEAFLQAQTMNDVAALAPGHWHWNGWLTPKGRVIALFALLRLAPDRFLAVLPDMPADAFRTALQRFVFRSKVTLADADVVAAAGIMPTPAVADAIAGDPAGGLAIGIDRDAGPRALWLLPVGQAAPAEPAVEAAWRAADIARGVPRLGVAQREAWTPQRLSLERLQAYSLRKGCYPGQEIVARTRYLGRLKQRTYRLHLPVDIAPEPGDKLYSAAFGPDQASGALLCAAPAPDGGFEGLAVVQTSAAQAGELKWKSPDGPTVELKSLPYSVAA